LVEVEVEVDTPAGVGVPLSPLKDVSAIAILERDKVSEEGAAVVDGGVADEVT
jgi:hypothetical protein